MIRSQLNSYSGADPIWGFVALIGSERYTGEAAVGIDPRVRLFAVDGRVYFAEREGDAPIGTRLVNCGAVSTTQLAAGSVQVGDTTSLARLFQRQPAIDRDAVELTIELATESLLESIANKAVGMPEVFPLRHHSSGVHHWLRSAVITAVPLVEHEVSVSEAPVVEISVAATLDAPPPADDLRFIEEAFVEEAIIEDLPVVETFTEEAVVAEYLAMTDEAATTEEDDVAEEAVIEEAVIEDVVVEEAEPEEAVVEDVVVEDVVVEEAAEEVVAAPAAWGAVLLSAPAPAEEIAIDEPVIDEPLIESSFAAPAAAFSLPTLSSFAQPAAEEVVLEVVVEEVVVEEAAAGEPYVEAAAAQDEPMTEAAPTAEPILAPMPTLASLSLPTLQSASTRSAAADSSEIDTSDITTEGFFASLAAQPDSTPVNPYEPGEPPADLPKLATAPISMNDLTSMNDLAAATSSAPSPFGEPTHNLAAVDIWEMVDVLTDDGQQQEQDLVGTGVSEKRGRGWLRGKKG